MKGKDGKGKGKGKDGKHGGKGAAAPTPEPYGPEAARKLEDEVSGAVAAASTMVESVSQLVDSKDLPSLGEADLTALGANVETQSTAARAKVKETQGIIMKKLQDLARVTSPPFMSLKAVLPKKLAQLAGLEPVLAKIKYDVQSQLDLRGMAQKLGELREKQAELAVFADQLKADASKVLELGGDEDGDASKQAVEAFETSQPKFQSALTSLKQQITLAVRSTMGKQDAQSTSLKKSAHEILVATSTLETTVASSVTSAMEQLEKVKTEVGTKELSDKAT